MRGLKSSEWGGGAEVPRLWLRRRSLLGAGTGEAGGDGSSIYQERKGEAGGRDRIEEEY